MDAASDEEDASNGGSERYQNGGRAAAGRGRRTRVSSSSRGGGGGFARRPAAEVRRELARLEQLTAAELLEALEAGAPLRKKWLVPEEEAKREESDGKKSRNKKKGRTTTTMSALAAVASVSAALASGDAAAASRAALAAFPAHLSPYALPSAAARRPVRHVSVFLEEARLGVSGVVSAAAGGGNAAAAAASSASAVASSANASSASSFSSALLVRYYHARSGKRLLSRARARAAEVRLVAVLAPGGTGGCWRPGASLLCLTSRGGVLALQAADAAAHAAWALGLNAGLALSGVRRRGALLGSRARSVPRSPVFLVVGEEE